jgi:hypothetical protein
VAAVAAQQSGVFGFDQAVALGWSPAAIHKRAERGHLHRLHRGVYSIVPPNLLKREGHWMAAVLAAGPGAVLSVRCAGALHGLRQYNGTILDVTIPSRVHRVQPGIRIHRSTTLTNDDTDTVAGIPCTTVARTLLDLADVLDRRALERAFDQAESNQVFDLIAIQDQLERNAGRSRATGLVNLVLNEHYLGGTPTANDFEEAMLRISRKIGIPDPEVNQWLILDDGEPPIKSDFMWRDQKLIVETDGKETHLTHQSFESDRRRDQRLTLLGWRVIRTTWLQLKTRPYELEAILRRLLLDQ